MKKILCSVLAIVLLSGCGAAEEPALERHSKEPTETTTITEKPTIHPGEPDECVDGEPHDVSGWKSDSEHHWLYCPKCRKKIQVEEHVLGDSNENHQRSCTICGRIIDDKHEHSIDEHIWMSNPEYHWHPCTVTYGLRGAACCQIGTQIEEHVFGKDSACVVCGRALSDQSYQYFFPEPLQ